MSNLYIYIYSQTQTGSKPQHLRAISWHGSFTKSSWFLPTKIDNIGDTHDQFLL